MRQGALLGGAGFLLLGLVAALAVLRIGPGPRPDPYAEMVERHFIRPPAGERPLLRARDDGEAGPVVRLDEPIPEAHRRFVDASPLRRDLIADDPALWRFREGKLVGIVPGRHAARPAMRMRPWRGRIAYRPSAGAPVPGGGWLAMPQDQPIRFEPDDPRRAAIDLVFTDQPPRTGDLASAGRLSYHPATRGGRLAASQVDLHCSRPPARSDGAILAPPDARLYRAGDQALLLVERDTCEIRVGGVEVRLAGRAPVAVPPGSVVALRARDGDEGLALVRPRFETARRLIVWTDRSGARQTDPALAGFAEAVDRDLGRALATARADPEATVALSLDAGLQAALADRLGRFVAEAPPARGAVPRRATVTILDALTGEVLAMAGHDESAGALVAGERVAPALERLPVGSAAKPIFAAAALAAAPGLRSLCVRIEAPDGRAGDVLGMPFAPPGLLTVPGASDLTDFLRRSSNGYMAALLLLASPEPGRPGPAKAGAGSYGFSGRCEGAGPRPKSIYDNPDTPLDPRVSGTLDPPPFADRLARIFAVNINPPLSTPRNPGHALWTGRFDRGCVGLAGAAGMSAPLGSDSIDAAPWRDLARRPGGAASLCAMTGASSPRREALGLTGRRSFTTEVLQSALGAGEGRWSAIKLAEAYARLVTGREVSARFLPAATPMPAPPLPAGLYPEEVRQAISAALATVVPEGTGSPAAAALLTLARDLAGRGLQLGQFGKTGTPTLARVDWSETDQEINRLIRRNCIVWEPDPLGRAVVRYSPGAGRCPQAIPGEVERRLAALARRQRALPERAQPGPDRDGRGDIFQFRDGQLVSVSPALQVERERVEGAVFVLVVTSAPQADGGLLAPVAPAAPRQAFVVAVQLAMEVPGGSGTAARFAAEVARDLLAERLARPPVATGGSA